MPVLSDVNVLLALCYDRHIHHATALSWLDAQGARAVVLCRSTQLSLLRLLCHAAVMGEDVCTMTQAWEVYDAVLGDDRFFFQSEPDNIEVALRRYTRASTASPMLWQDAYLAAFALTAGMHLVTFDHGFREFPGLSVVLLGE
jgi:toxin-antitoxin system PIN domain toxin